ncbi:MAG: homocysteine S-methyltransferase family protein, partial [Allobranchiibius sp.]
MTRLDNVMSQIDAGATVLIDGGTGTECERRGVPVLDGAWSSGGALSHPEIVREVHQDYIAAGARVVIANTFSTHRHALEAAGVADNFVAYNRHACELAAQARQAAGDDAVVVAAGISNWTFTGRHPELDVLRRNTAEQAEAMASGGAELLILEMMVDIDRMRATLDGTRASGLPVWVGFTCGTVDGRPVSDDGVPRLRDGEPLADAIAALEDFDVDAV